MSCFVCDKGEPSLSFKTETFRFCAIYEIILLKFHFFLREHMHYKYIYVQYRKHAISVVIRNIIVPIFVKLYYNANNSYSEHSKIEK